MFNDLGYVWSYLFTNKYETDVLGRTADFQSS